MGMLKEVKTQTLGEEIANSISHGVGAGLSVAALVLLIVKATYNSGALGVVSACIYGGSLVLLYLLSCLYHALAKTGAGKVFQILDHCSIFILIVGTYTPIALNYIKGTLGWTIFGIQAGCMVLGIVFNAINMEKWKKASLALYVIMGWMIVFSIKSILSFPSNALWFLVLGGVAYTVGIIFYKNKKLKFFHFIWHIFVLAGSVLQFFCVYFYVY
ncbi:MAG: hemolysin III family protein [Clostridia bacterium]|nr:hemolysin III family protein [Clostridia bacterium]